MAEHIIESLQLFGLTRQEANIYLALCQNGTMTGYEVAKLTGVSRSNAYNALAGLVDKGAAYTEEGKSVKYVPVEAEEFLDAKMICFKKEKEYLLKNMPRRKEEGAEGYLTVLSDDHIADRIHCMMVSATKRIYIRMSANQLQLFREELEELEEQKIKVVLLTNQEVDLPYTTCYMTRIEPNQVGVITDSVNVLTGEFGMGQESTCLYTGQKNFVHVFKESLKNEIKLIELTGGKK